MSSDYRPRGASGSSSSSSGGGGRRRRGGRGRSSGGSHGHSHSENRVHTNGGPSAPKKKEGIISKFLGLFKGKKDKPETKHTPRSATTSRPEFKERTPGAERTERVERPRREDRPPKAEAPPQEITSPKLYVGNLAYEAAESDLFDLFSKVGAVKNVEVAMDRHANRSKGFGFVEMESLETAKEAAAKLNRTDFMGRQIVVSGAKVDKRVNQSPRDPDPTSHEHQRETGSSPDATA
jgi:RNA recognition motif-containing protein